MNNSSYGNEKMVGLLRDRIFGKYQGRVINNNDPFHRGRLEVIVPDILQSTQVWAMPCLPFGGKDMGLFMVPDKGAGVWVEFEGGNVKHPIWTGCYWGDDESPKDNKTDEPKVRMIRSEKGLTISLDDEDEIVTIKDKEENHTITIDVNGGKITIKSSQTVVIDAGQVKLGDEFGLQPVPMGHSLVAYLATIATAINAIVPFSVLPPSPDLLSLHVQTT